MVKPIQLFVMSMVGGVLGVALGMVIINLLG